ncbi:methyltransferase (DUF5917) [Popillia japonica]|uniref:Methyltransferase (DUF5917) n=1 Tax=Popillia japonica TaxID=7064 RepID=A0AAW1MTR0_POPJA
MDWLRNNPFIGQPRPQRALMSPEEECDPSACYDSFREHWQQVLKIIQRNQQLPSHDDVLGVVNHLEQMVSLLLYDIKKFKQIAVPLATSQCLEYLLSENLLDKLYEWGIRTGKYFNAVRLEQLKLYEMLVSQSRHLLLVHEPFLRPMLKLLESCQRDVPPRAIEKILVALLYQLCILLMQNVDLVDLFIKKEQRSKFIIFNLLINFVHRDDSIGMQARDALLLCMSLSKKKKSIADVILDQSNLCILLASGLGGLYSVLPHVITDITVPDWHRLTTDDVKDIKDLSTFITSLEFCNAVAQVAHPTIANDLQEFMHKGFLIPVLGPALLQTTIGEQITATAYLELILRTVTHPGLLYPLLQFLLQIEYDGQRLLIILMNRINAEPQLSLVSLALFESLIDLNCEDVMLELVFQYLAPCLHLMLSQRRLLLPLDPQCQNFERLLALAPSCCETPSTSPRLDGRPVHWNHYGGQQSLYGNFHAYLCDARSKLNLCQVACAQWANAYTGCENIDSNQSMNSLGESSGYASLKMRSDNNDENLPAWQVSQSSIRCRKLYSENRKVEEDDCLKASGTAGPFLTILLEKLKLLLNNTFYVNLHLTGLISRLAVYSQPLLRTYLLDQSLVLQPNVPSLFQILGALKQTIDEYMHRQPDRLSLIEQARNFMLDREARLVNARRNERVDRNSLFSTPSTNENEQSFQRNSPKRRSLTYLTGIFGRRPSQIETTIPLTNHSEEVENNVYPKFNEAQHVAVCAVLLDEWVKELAALAQEHTISQLAAFFK